jgi:beta-lactamase regulating signal transducer with metallopeptidase domain
MNQLALSLAWCWVQVFVVAGLAIALAAMSLRRSPRMSATIAWTGVLAVLVLTALAPIPIQRWEFAKRAMPSMTTRSAFTLLPAAGEMTNSPRDETTSSPTGRVFRADLLRDLIASLERSQAVVTNQEMAGLAILGVLVASVLCSLARVACGLWAIAVLYRHSRSVTDRRIADLLAKLQPRMRLRRLPPVRETSMLASAAVVGAWRPIVMLPNEWREWSPSEQEAVLAHELAHVCRRDAFVRLVAVIAGALQCAQPLVYWLRWQLMLAQELAADDIAAAAIGERTQYLQALTRLALRLDSRPIDRPAPMLLPVFSGFLLRRIEMLRAKDGSTHSRRLPLLQGSAVATLVAVTLVATAVRGLAQPPGAPADESVRVAKAKDAKARPAADQRQPAQPFQRPPFDPAAVAMSGRGGFIVRLGEVLGRSDLGTPTRELNESFLAGWKAVFPTAAPPAWPLQDIEYIAGDFQLTVKRMAQPTDEQHPNAVMFGAECVVIHWKQPLNGQWETLQGIPGVVEKTHGAVKYVELPVIPGLGPTKPCVSRLDANSLLAATSEEGIRRRLDQLAAGAAQPVWRKSWDAVEGGVLTVVAADGQITRPLGTPADAESKWLHDLFTHGRLYAIGVDWLASGAGVVKVQLRCDTEEAANLVGRAIQGCVDQAVNELQVTAIGAGAKAKIANSYLESLRQTKIEARQVDDGWHVAVQFSGLDVRAVLADL